MITRRQFISFSATSAAFAAAGTSLTGKGYAEGLQPGPSPSGDALEKIPAWLQSGSKKKGLGMNTWNNPSWAERVISLHCKWYYTWSGFLPEDTPQGMEFVPMVRSRHANTDMINKFRNSFQGHGVKELLGPNEPDAKKQDNMTVQEALDLWPLLMETGLRLGSPACVHPDKEWMIEFMAGVEERKLRVDFICMHSYGKPNPEALVTRLEKLHKMFDRPIWITEFGVGDWEAKTVEENQHSSETVLRFMEKVLPKLDDLDCLERYAWFPSKPANPALGTSALFDDDGVLTPLGEFYRDA